MPFDTYDELVAGVANWLDRADQANNIPMFIRLTERYLDRQLETQQQRTTGTALVEPGNELVTKPAGLKRVVQAQPIGVWRGELGAQTGASSLASPLGLVNELSTTGPHGGVVDGTVEILDNEGAPFRAGIIEVVSPTVLRFDRIPLTSEFDAGNAVTTYAEELLIETQSFPTMERYSWARFMETRPARSPVGKYTEPGFPKYFADYPDGDSWAVGPVSGGYEIEFTYQLGVPPLGPARQTNRVLQEYPELYLFGALSQAEDFLKYEGEQRRFGPQFTGLLAWANRDADKEEYSGSTLRTASPYGPDKPVSHRRRGRA